MTYRLWINVLEVSRRCFKVLRVPGKDILSVLATLWIAEWTLTLRDALFTVSRCPASRKSLIKGTIGACHSSSPLMNGTHQSHPLGSSIIVHLFNHRKVSLMKYKVTGMSIYAE
jgi:hypothetical protein